MVEMMPPTIAKLSIRGIGVLIALAIITTLAVALVVQSVRLDGLKIWPFEITGWKPRAEQLSGELAAIATAEALADQLARDQKQRVESEYADLSERIDHDVQTNLGGALVAVDHFISRGGVDDGMRGEALGCPPGTSTPASDSKGARNLVGAGGTPQLDAARPTPRKTAELKKVVGVFADDVLICTINTAKAEAAHDWAVGVNEANAQNIQPNPKGDQ